MQNIVIREFKSGDKKTLARCIEDLQGHLVRVDRWNAIRRPCKGFGEQYTKDLLKQVQKEEGKIFVAERKRAIIGCVAGVIKRYKEQEASCLASSMNGRVLELYVDERFRGKNVGRRLMDVMEHYFRERGCSFVRVEAFAPNSVARKFYRKKLKYQVWLVDYVKEL